MQKQSFTAEQVPDSDDMFESLESRVMSITQEDPKPKDTAQGSKEHCDDLFESLQTQEMFITQKEPKLKDQVSDTDDLFESSQEMFLTQRNCQKPKDQVSYSKSHQYEERTQKYRKRRQLPKKQFREKLLWGKVRDLKEKRRVASSQTSLHEETQRDAQLASVDELFVPTQNHQRLDTQMFSVSYRDPEPVVNDSQDLISPIVAEGDKKENPDKNTSSTEMTATTSSQTDLTLEHMQSQKYFSPCLDCEYLLLTAETLMHLVRIIYDNSRFRYRTLSSNKFMPDRLKGSERKRADSSSQMRSSSKDMRNSFLNEIRSLKENLDTNFRNKDKDMEDSGIWDDKDTDESESYPLELDTKSPNKSNTAKNLEAKKRKVGEAETKGVKHWKKEDEIERVGKSQKKKRKAQTIKKSCGCESRLDNPVDILPCPHKLKRQWKKKKLLGETLLVGSATSKSKKLSEKRKKSKAGRGDALSSIEFESNQKVKPLEKRLLQKTKKSKKKGRKSGRVKTEQHKMWKSCAQLDVKVKHERRKKQGASIKGRSPEKR